MADGLDYKYGLRVLVVAVTAAPQWTDTQRGLDIGSLTAFGMIYRISLLGSM